MKPKHWHLQMCFDQTPTYHAATIPDQTQKPFEGVCEGVAGLVRGARVVKSMSESAEGEDYVRPFHEGCRLGSSAAWKIIHIHDEVRAEAQVQAVQHVLAVFLSKALTPAEF